MIDPGAQSSQKQTTPLWAADGQDGPNTIPYRVWSGHGTPGATAPGGVDEVRPPNVAFDDMVPNDQSGMKGFIDTIGDHHADLLFRYDYEQFNTLWNDYRKNASGFATWWNQKDLP